MESARPRNATLRYTMILRWGQRRARCIWIHPCVRSASIQPPMGLCSSGTGEAL